MEEMALHDNNDDLNLLHWWYNASYGTHPDLKGHTGAIILVGKGGVTSISKKHKINTIISTISELVGVHKYSPQVLSTKSFLQNQGSNINKATLYQDNNSAVLIGGNDRASRSSCTKHVNIRNFFIKNHIDKGKVIVEHCPIN